MLLATCPICTAREVASRGACRSVLEDRQDIREVKLTIPWEDHHNRSDRYWHPQVSPPYDLAVEFLFAVPLS